MEQKPQRTGPIKRPRMRTLGRTGSKLFVIGSILAAVIVSYLAASLILRSATDPVVQERIESLRTNGPPGAAPPDSSIQASPPPADTLSERPGAIPGQL